MIGITGGIGSGKSTIAQELAKRGFTVYDCDREAKRIIQEDAQVRQAIISLLGEEAFSISRSPFSIRYNTAYVAQLVFADPTLLQQLNAIVHPAVKADILSKQPDVIESAILFEAGLDALCDKIVQVDAPEQTRIARTIERDYAGHATPDNIEKVRARIHAQQKSSAGTNAQRREIITLTNDGNTSIADLAEQIL